MSEKISRFAHIIPVSGNVFALYHALWLRVLYFNHELLPFVTALVDHKMCLGDALTLLREDASIQGKALYAEMCQEKFFAVDEDETKLAEIKNTISGLKISMMYLVITNECNLMCHYCYLSQALWVGEQRKMEIDTARKAIDLFASVVNLHQVEDPQIIFYGGEPLLNPEILEFSLQYAKSKVPLCSFTVNTNGTQVTPALAALFTEYAVEVAISIDGPQGIHDQSRQYRGGRGSFERVIDNYRLLKKSGVNTGISCTITQSNVDHLLDVTHWLITELEIESFGFNLLIGEFDSAEQERQYADKTAQALVDCFQIARQAGVYEDRMMRRVNALSDGRVALNDCGACGQQMVVAPDCQVGVCQGFLNTKENLYPLESLGDDPTQHELWTIWRNRSPFNIDWCADCEALGICGGGCAYNSLLRNGSIMTPDFVHCVHAKAALRFLLQDLWKIMHNQ